MKYIVSFIILCILLTGCSKEEVSKEMQQYQNILDQLKTESIKNKELPMVI